MTKLVVGLGNIGKEYTGTRHNIGFSILNEYAGNKKIEFSKEKFKGNYAEFNNNGEKVILLKPGKFMNLSGEVIRDFINFYKIENENLLIIYDDMDIELESYKLKPKGSSGGHNGLKNIELHLHTKQYNRLKVGISKSGRIEGANYVLGKFNKTEIEKLKSVVEQSILIIDDFLVDDFEKVMNKYN